MELDCLMNQGQNFFTRIARSDTSGKVGNVGPKRRRAFFDYHQIAHFVNSFTPTF